jgi:AmpE protein
MTIIAILLAFALCHFIRELARFRQNQWLAGWINFANQTFRKIPGWADIVGFLVIPAVPLLILLILNQAMISTLGSTGIFILAIVVLVYTFGPRDLDTEVAAIIDSDDDDLTEKGLRALMRAEVPEDEDACRALAVESVFREALRRWFGVIFWFAVLGIVGAFLYRMIDWLVSEDYTLTDDQRSLFRRMQQIMDWPAAQLMTLSLAIATD